MDGPDWKIYERMAAVHLTESSDGGIELSMTPNAQIRGCLSLVDRQVDILIDARWGDDLSKRIIVDAKRYKDRIDVKDVESFEGMMKDCRATHGIIVCPNGWTPGAENRANGKITLTRLTLEDLDNDDWKIRFGECLGKCSRPRLREKHGLVFWDAEHLIEIGGAFVVLFSGKCDVCHEYHVWCWDCGDKFAIPTEETYQCFCGYQWASLIEEDIDDPSGQTLNAVHLLLEIGGNVFALDRRMLR